jgi:hypothetical protein
MKKLVLFALIVGSVCAPLIAQSGGGAKKPGLFSAGGGGLFTADFTKYTLTSEATSGENGRDGDSSDTVLVGGGINLFFDAAYAEVNLGLVFGQSNSTNSKVKDTEGYHPTDISALRIGALGKYPIALNNKFTVFPALGLDYEIVLSAKNDGKDGTYPVSDSTAGSNEDGSPRKGADATEALSALWFKAGVGGDYALTDALYLRGEFLYGLRLHNKMEKYGLDTKNSEVDSVVGHGLDVKVAVGYRF